MGNETLFESWDQSTNSIVGRVSPFAHNLGASGLSLSFRNEESILGVSNSLYETFYYYSNFIDPNFQICLTSANLFGLVSIRFVNDDVLPFNHTAYSETLTNSFNSFINDPRVTSYNSTLTQIQLSQFNTSLNQISSLISSFSTSSSALQSELVTLKTMGKQSKNYDTRLRIANDKSMLIERSFTLQNGISGRPWFKNVIYSVSKQNGFGVQVFPGVMDAIAVSQPNFNSVILGFQQVNQALTATLNLLE